MKKLDEMTIVDVVMTEEFYKHLKNEIDHTLSLRNKARSEALKNGSDLKAHSLDVLKEDGILDTKRFKEEFIKVVDKMSLLPRSQRDVIEVVGSVAYRNTINELIENERN